MEGQDISSNTVVIILKPAPSEEWQPFKEAFRGVPDIKYTGFVLHWIGLVESVPNLVSIGIIGFIFW